MRKNEQKFLKLFVFSQIHSSQTRTCNFVTQDSRLSPKEISKNNLEPVWWLLTIIPTRRRLRQEDHSTFEAILVYRVGSGLA